MGGVYYFSINIKFYKTNVSFTWNLFHMKDYVFPLSDDGKKPKLSLKLIGFFFIAIKKESNLFLF